MRKIMMGVALAGVMLSGCVSVKNAPLDTAAASSMSGQSLAYTKREKPAFSAMTADKAMFAAVGGAMMIAAGNEIVAKNQVEDPSAAIAQALSQALASARGVQVAETPIGIDSEKPEEIVALAGGARYVIDVRTIYWGFGYFSTDWTHYRIMYTARLRLIDSASKKVIAEGFCPVIPKEKKPDAPTYDELMNDNAAGLKRELTAAGEQCVNQFKTETLKL